MVFATSVCVWVLSLSCENTFFNVVHENLSDAKNQNDVSRNRNEDIGIQIKRFKISCIKHQLLIVSNNFTFFYHLLQVCIHESVVWHD